MLIDLTAPIEELTDHGIVTHVDLWDNGTEIELERFRSRAFTVDVSYVQGRRIQFGDLKNLPQINPGESILFYTGWSKFRGTDLYMNHPEIDIDVIHWCLDSKFNFVGIDTPGLGLGDHHLLADKTLCTNGIYIIENLVNLDRIKQTFCTLACFPLKRNNVNAQWARVLAEI